METVKNPDAGKVRVELNAGKKTKTDEKLPKTAPKKTQPEKQPKKTKAQATVKVETTTVKAQAAEKQPIQNNKVVHVTEELPVYLL